MRFVLAAAGMLVVAMLSMGASSCSDVANSSDAEDQAKAHWGEVTFGMSESEVTAILGEPTDRQEQQIDATEFGGGTSTSVCIYYGIGTYQLCFEDDELRAKNRY
jgi:hypothetical protein